MDLLGLPATARASFACYNTLAEVEQLERGRAQGASRYSADAAHRALSRGDPRPQQASAQFRPARSARRGGQGPQPAVRRPAHRHAASRRRSHRRPALRGQRLRHLDGLGLDDDRGRQGQGPRRPSTHCSSASTRCSPRHGASSDGPGQAGRAVRRARIPGAREMRQPVLAHAECRPGPGRCRSAGTVSHRVSMAPQSRTIRHPARGGRGDGALRACHQAAARPCRLHQPGAGRQLHAVHRRQPLPPRRQRCRCHRQGAGACARTAAQCHRRRCAGSSPGSR